MEKARYPAILTGGYVKDETRAKIQKVIEEYNYAPNAFARLNAKQSNVIGVVVPTLNSKITSRVITSIDRYLREKGYTTLIQNSDHDIDQELQNIQRLIQLNVDGILISSIAITKDHKGAVKESGIPVVVLTQVIMKMEFPLFMMIIMQGKRSESISGRKDIKRLDILVSMRQTRQLGSSVEMAC